MTDPPAPTPRSQAIAAALAAQKKIAAVYPIHAPRALLCAFDLFPVEVWGPPQVASDRGSEHVQAYVCSIVRNGLSFLLDGGLDACELILVPHCCDSLQGLGSLLHDFIKPRQDVLTLYLPRRGDAIGVDFLRAELDRLYERLAQITDLRPDEARLMDCLQQERRADRALKELCARRSQLSIDDNSFYNYIRSREYLDCHSFISLCQACPAGSDDPQGTPLLLSGIVPEPPGLLQAFASAGAYVVADDLACNGRRHYTRYDSDDPLRAMAQYLLSGPPDPMLGASIADRAEHLAALVDEHQAAGVVFAPVKFCEPELFDHPQLTAALRARGIPSLVLDVDISETFSAQLATRLEAFVEMLS